MGYTDRSVERLAMAVCMPTIQLRNHRVVSSKRKLYLQALDSVHQLRASDTGKTVAVGCGWCLVSEMKMLTLFVVLCTSDDLVQQLLNNMSVVSAGSLISAVLECLAYMR